MSEDHYQWSPLSLIEVNRLFYNLPVPWWLAGGKALDLFVGSPVREHTDIDVGIFREDQLIVQAHLSNWDLHAAGSSKLVPWKQGNFLELGINQVWCRRTPASLWELEIMFMERDGDDWYFRRNPQIRGRISGLILHTEAGIPYLSPEIQLLFKARAVIPTKDALDFRAVLPHLDQGQRSWLLSSLRTAFPTGHLWIDMLG